MKLYNSLSGKLEEFKPQVEGLVTMYVCGPTVYNHAHIGNARPIVVFDTLRRVFEALGYQVKFVSNFTDVDDKIINQAKETNQSEQAITEYYIKAYNEVRQKLNTLPFNSTPKVTETISEIIAFIQELIDLDFAYEVDGDVYFRVDKITTYGQLSKQKIEDLVVGARIEENSKKENPLDFVLWKASEEGLNWQTNWSVGRPGWHTECVVMINKEFGNQKIDIHGGGMDLKFPHHENEIAQNQALHNHSIANYWLHNGMLDFDGTKMSKSLGNVLWAKDVVDSLGSNVTRWVLLSAHYRAPLKFNDEAIKQAQTELNKVLTALKQAYIKVAIMDIDWNTEYDLETFNKFLLAMSDDLNTQNAYMEIFETVKLLNNKIRAKDIDWHQVISLSNSIIKMLDVLGIEVDLPKVTTSDKELFNKWELAKQEKDFKSADKYRTQLLERGLI